MTLLQIHDDSTINIILALLLLLLFLIFFKIIIIIIISSSSSSSMGTPLVLSVIKTNYVKCYVCF